MSTVDTSALGTPVANWDSDGCTIPEFFEPQQLVFNIALCGRELSLVFPSEHITKLTRLPYYRIRRRDRHLRANMLRHLL